MNYNNIGTRFPTQPQVGLTQPQVKPESPEDQTETTVGAGWPYDLDPPPEFGIDPSTLKTEEQVQDFLASFDQWHSDFWVKYIEKYGKDGVLNIPTEGTPVRTAVISVTDPQKAFIVQRLNAMDFAMLTYEDQVKISKTAAFDAVKFSFGFERYAEAKFDGVSFNDYIDKVINDIRAKTDKMSKADVEPYLDQLLRLRGQVNGQEIIKPSTIHKKISDIKDAFDRALHFADIRPQKYEPSRQADAHYSDVISLDDGAAIAEGRKVFIQSDREIASTEARLQAMLQDTQKRDPATLIMEIMRLNQTITDARTLRESEELKQQNELLQTYAAMQNAINETLREFGEPKEGETKTVTLYGKTNYADLTDRQKKVVTMFSTLFGKDAQQHPLEESRGIERPLMDLVGKDAPESGSGYSLKAYTNAQWNTFGSQLAEVVTLLGQNTQIKMNEIATIRQLGTSQFEMATKALSKAAELIATIGRNLS